MLILSRRVGDVLRIGDDIEVVVLGIQSRQIKIGIEAPRDIPVMREEIYTPSTDEEPPNQKVAVGREK